MVLIYILLFEIHFSPANHLKSNHSRFFERLKLLQKCPKLTKKVKKMCKKWICHFLEKCSCSKAKQDRGFPFDTFLPNDPLLMKSEKKYISEKFVVLEDRTTLIRRRIDVMVGSPSKKLWWTWNICRFLEKCLWQAWLSPIQHEQSSFQHQFDQKTSIFKCKFMIGTGMNTLLWNG